VWRPTLRAPGSGTKELWNSDLTLRRSGLQSSTINDAKCDGPDFEIITEFSHKCGNENKIISCLFMAYTINSLHGLV
jgi:hypothetical protein